MSDDFCEFNGWVVARGNKAMSFTQARTRTGAIRLFCKAMSEICRASSPKDGVWTKPHPLTPDERKFWKAQTKKGVSVNRGRFTVDVQANLQPSNDLYSYVLRSKIGSKFDVFGREFSDPNEAREAMMHALMVVRDVEAACLGRVVPIFSKQTTTALKVMETIQVDAWVPDFDNLEDGFECLVWHRGKWRHVRWAAGLGGGFSLGYGEPYIAHDLKEPSMWAQLPPKPEGQDGFFDWKD